MIKLYLVRHGETDGNINQWFQGTTDVPLNNRGIAQAECLSRFFQEVPFAAVYSSTLCRARKTAKIIAAPHKLAVQSFPELSEVNFGVWEGHCFEEIEEKWPGEIEAFYASEGAQCARGGESFHEVEERITTKTKALMAQHQDGESVLLVSHGAAIRCLLFGLLGLKMGRLWVFQQYNTAFTIIEYHGEKNVMTLLNCTKHLEHSSGHQH